MTDRPALGTAQIVRGNALALPLADSSVDLVVTSPPYFSLRSYQDGGRHYEGQVGGEATPAEYVEALVAATREMVRVLKPAGSIWVNLGDKYSGAQQQTSGRQSTMTSAEYWARTNPRTTGVKAKSLYGIPWRYALRCMDDLGLILRAEVIWSKPNALPESVRDRVRRSHETWFHFVPEPRYFADLDPVPTSVWSVSNQPFKVPASLGVDHFAAFPMELPRRIIRGWSPVGGTVLDPFGGTGTTALVAKAWGRHGISNDMSADYCRLATWRTHDEDQLAAAMREDAAPKRRRSPAPSPL